MGVRVYVFVYVHVRVCVCVRAYAIYSFFVPRNCSYFILCFRLISRLWQKLRCSYDARENKKIESENVRRYSSIL